MAQTFSVDNLSEFINYISFCDINKYICESGELAPYNIPTYIQFKYIESFNFKCTRLYTELQIKHFYSRLIPGRWNNKNNSHMVSAFDTVMMDSVNPGSIEILVYLVQNKNVDCSLPQFPLKRFVGDNTIDRCYNKNYPQDITILQYYTAEFSKILNNGQPKIGIGYSISETKLNFLLKKISAAQALDIANKLYSHFPQNIPDTKTTVVPIITNPITEKTVEKTITSSNETPNNLTNLELSFLKYKEEKEIEQKNFMEIINNLTNVVSKQQEQIAKFYTNK